MAKSREDIQDIALYHMEKQNRRNREETKKVTLKEELEHLSLSPEDKRKRMSQRDWNIEVREYCLDSKNGCGANLLSWVQVKYKADFEKFKENGTAFNEILTFVKSKKEEHINR